MYICVPSLYRIFRPNVQFFLMLTAAGACPALPVHPNASCVLPGATFPLQILLSGWHLSWLPVPAALQLQEGQTVGSCVAALLTWAELAEGRQQLFHTSMLSDTISTRFYEANTEISQILTLHNCYTFCLHSWIWFWSDQCIFHHMQLRKIKPVQCSMHRQELLTASWCRWELGSSVLLLCVSLFQAGWVLTSKTWLCLF